MEPVGAAVVVAFLEKKPLQRPLLHVLYVHWELELHAALKFPLLIWSMELLA